MPNSFPQRAENATLHATDRLMHWMHLLLSKPNIYAQTPAGVFFPVRDNPRNEIIIRQLLILYKLKDLQCFSEFLNATGIAPLAILLPALFYLESIHSYIGLLFLQHSQLKFQFGYGAVHTAILPSFAYPIHCIICFCEIGKFDSKNYYSLKPKSATCGKPCRYEWEKQWKTFDEAITAFNQLNNARKAFHLEASVENRSIYWEAMSDHLPVLFKAYEYLATHLEERWDGQHSYAPRYTLSPHWQTGKYWYPQSGIITRENINCLFNDSLIGKQIVVHTKKAGQPCEFDGSPLIYSKQTVLIDELKEYLIDNPDGMTGDIVSSKGF